MTYHSGYQCTICQTKYPITYQHFTCEHCGETGILDVLYDYEAMKETITKDYFQENQEYSMLRYQPLMTIKPPTVETLKVGWTPLYHATSLQQQLHIKQLLLKDETVNPTASLKDRASLVACLKAIEANADTICCSSTGNAASSLAGNAAKLGLKTVIVVPKRAPVGKLTQLVMYGSTVLQVEGDYKDAFQLSKQLIDQYGLYNRNAAINPHLVEGKKTVVYEIIEQLQFSVPDYILVSVGDGCTIAGVYKGLYDLKQLDLIDRLPVIIGVQAEGCAPFYQAFVENKPLVETEEHTFADSIAVGIPRNPMKGMNAVKQTKGFYMTVTDDQIRNAMETLGQTEGLFAEPAGATALAGLIQLSQRGNVEPNASYVVLITGNGLKDPTSVQSLVSQKRLLFDPKQDNNVFDTEKNLQVALHKLTERRNQHD